MLLKEIRHHSRRILVWWVMLVSRYALIAVLLCFLATAGALVYAIVNFAMTTELSDMISDKLRFIRLDKELLEAFPDLVDRIVVVIDAESPEAARRQRNRMVERLKNEDHLFERISVPGGGAFFEQNGLLYLGVDELQALADRVAEVQPFLGFLGTDFSVRGIFSMLEKMMASDGSPENKERVVPLLDGISEALENAAAGRPYEFSWQTLMTGEKAARGLSRQFIIIKPKLDHSTLSTGEQAIHAVRRIRDELGLDGTSAVRVRLTGDVLLSYENLRAARSGIEIAGLISIILVATTLVVGLGSYRLVLASLLTLLTGLIWTFGVAIAMVGHLNLISITFAVLFIGLGIDYSIHFCLRYRELIAAGLAHHEALARTAQGEGRGLLCCTFTTAIGFYSFVPTAYAGVSELGLISGTGMFINLFATLTALPALLSLMPLRMDRIKPFRSSEGLDLLPYRHAKAIRRGALALGMASALLLPRVTFDANPLNLYDPASESVSTMKELLSDPKSSPWTISALAGNVEEARDLARRLKGLKEVRQVVTLEDFIPGEQSEKLEIISDMDVLMAHGLRISKSEDLDYEEKVLALDALESYLGGLLSQYPEETSDYAASIRRLQGAVERFKAGLADPKEGRRAFERLETSLLSTLPDLLTSFMTSLQAHEFTARDLPQELRSQYVSSDGRYRVQVFPAENIFDHDALERFVEAVTSVAPNAIDTPVKIVEAGKAVVRSFFQASIYAVVAITVFVLIYFNSLGATVVILLPLVFAVLLTGAASVLAGVPFNFANVIVIPLLLGVGVDSGIHFVHRYRAEPPAHGIMLKTSTARAVFFSTLTTIVSFASLCFSPHRGMASIGKLLTICVGSLMISTLFLLPALLQLWKGSGRRPEA